MSFILDALRKSEHERQRHAGPGIAELPLARARSRLPAVLLLIAALLAINLGAWLYFMLRKEAPANEAPAVSQQQVAPSAAPPTPAASSGTPAAAPAAAPASSTTPATAPAAAPASSTAPAAAPPAAIPPPPRREVRPLAEEASPQPAPLAEEAPGAPDPSLLPPSPALVAATSGARRQPAAPRAADESVPRIDSLPASATAGLPVLNLELHIYASDPSQRAVFINGRRYREGDSMPEGPVISSITTDGVVLGYRGQRFLLPRP